MSSPLEPVPGRSAATVVFLARRGRRLLVLGWASVRRTGGDPTNATHPPLLAGSTSIVHFFHFHLLARERYSMPRTAKSKGKQARANPCYLYVSISRLSHLIFNAK